MDPLNLAAACLERHAADPATAGTPALTFVAADGGLERWTFAEAWSRVQGAARGLLDAGLAPGERVVVRLPNGPEYAFAFFGAVLAGLVPVPASPKLTVDEVAFLLGDAEASAIVTATDGAVAEAAGIPALAAAVLSPLPGGAARPLPRTLADDPAYLIYTSGTSARPKGVLHAHRSIRARMLMCAGWEGFEPGDTVMHAGTINWSYTLGVGLMDTWMAGAHAVLCAGDQGPERWPALMTEHGVTVFAAVPTVYRQMLKYARPEEHDLSRLRHVLCAGEALLPVLRDEWLRRGGTEMYEALGMTEISTYISTGPGMAVRPGSPGKPQPGRRVAILPQDSASTEPLPVGETGVLAVHRSDPGLMLRYWNRPEEEASVYRGDWFVGGDLASFDGDGYLWFKGRADDVIGSFGLRLSPLEIEAVLASCPGVAEAGVVGEPVDEQKTLVTACIVPTAPDAVDEAALRAHAAEHLAAYKHPHRYVFLDALPRAVSGKLLRRQLLEQITANR